MEDYLYEDLYRQEEKHWWHVAKRELSRRLIRRYNPARLPKILDIGCGTGKNIEELGEIGEAWGIDISPQAIAFCKKRGLIRVKTAPSEHTGYPKQVFDVVTLFDVLEHTEEKGALEEIYRILKPQGILLVTVPAFPWLWSRWDEVLHHRRRYTVRALRQALETYGFTVKKISYLYAFLILPVMLVRLYKTFKYRGRSYSSDFTHTSTFANWLLLRFAGWERLMFEKVSLPFGTSVMAVAQKA